MNFRLFSWAFTLLTVKKCLDQIKFLEHVPSDTEDFEQLNSAMTLSCYEMLIWLKDSRLEDM